jgi:predicted metal-binding membrane protein
VETQRRVRQALSRVVTIAPPDRSFFIATVLVFAASAAVTIAWCASMSQMEGMPMPGDWTMSMAWMRMPGQTWADTAGTFLGMWAVMMVAMMLPSLLPMLRRYRQAVGSAAGPHLDGLTAVVASAYFCAWILLGVTVFPLGALLSGLAMRSDALARGVPLATGLIVLAAGALQLTAWKQQQLDCCRRPPRRRLVLSADVGTAWRHGVRLGLHCIACCAGLTVTLLVIGVMDLPVMAVVAAAITAERVLPAGERVARAIGVGLVLTGVFLLAPAVT